MNAGAWIVRRGKEVSENKCYAHLFFGGKVDVECDIAHNVQITIVRHDANALIK